MDPKKKAVEKARRGMITAASVAAVAAWAMFVQAVTNQARESFLFTFNSAYNSLKRFAFRTMRSWFSSEHTIIFQPESGRYSTNNFNITVSSYLASRIPTSVTILKVGKNEQQSTFIHSLSLEPGEKMVDVFQGIRFTWSVLSGSGVDDGRDLMEDMPTRKYVLKFNKKHKQFVLDSYIPYIVAWHKEINEADTTIKLYMNDSIRWNSIVLNHPATFDTVAMDPEIKQLLIDDLNRFLGRKDYYRKIGKAWKRGYLLYGPPGTGKSSLIAAMANYLKFSIYDLELSNVSSNDQLRSLLIKTSSRSIILVEDFDCSIQLQRRDVPDCDDSSGRRLAPSKAGESKITLSGLLNFLDGLCSSLGDERIFVFTTNYKNRLDPALLRPGRMDVHIHMGYCRMSSFRLLASNYHGVDEHPMFRVIERMLEEVDVTPAEVTEKLMIDDWEVAIESLVQFIEQKKRTRLSCTDEVMEA